MPGRIPPRAGTGLFALASLGAQLRGGGTSPRASPPYEGMYYNRACMLSMSIASAMCMWLDRRFRDTPALPSCSLSNAPIHTAAPAPTFIAIAMSSALVLLSLAPGHHPVTNPARGAVTTRHQRVWGTGMHRGAMQKGLGNVWHRSGAERVYSPLLGSRGNHTSMGFLLLPYSCSTT